MIRQDTAHISQRVSELNARALFGALFARKLLVITRYAKLFATRGWGWQATTPDEKDRQMCATARGSARVRLTLRRLPKSHFVGSFGATYALFARAFVRVFSPVALGCRLNRQHCYELGRARTDPY